MGVRSWWTVPAGRANATTVAVQHPGLRSRLGAVDALNNQRSGVCCDMNGDGEDQFDSDSAQHKGDGPKVCGISVQYDIDYSVPWNKRKPDPNKISSVLLPLTDEEWCFICMRDREGYIGPCCGNTGAMQDIINSVFRDSGWIKSDDFLYLGIQAIGHDGFDEFSDTGIEPEVFLAKMHDAKMRQGVISDEIGVRGDPWAKIGLIFTLLCDKLQPKKHGINGPGLPETREKDCVTILSNGLNYLRYEDLFSRDTDIGKQTHANRLLLLARVIPVAKKVVALLDKNNEPFDGYAIVEVGTDNVLSTRMGLCLFDSEAEVHRIIDLWEKGDPGTAANVAVRPVRVTTTDGIVFQGGPL